MRVIASTRSMGKTHQIVRLFVKDHDGILIVPNSAMKQHVLTEVLPNLIPDISSSQSLGMYSKRICTARGLRNGELRGFRGHLYIDEVNMCLPELLNCPPFTLAAVSVSLD